MSGPVTHRGRLAFEAGRSGEGWPPALDGPAVGRLIRALEAGVRGPGLEARFGRNVCDLRRVARENGWDGLSADAAPLGAPEAAHVPRRWERRAGLTWDEREDG